MDFESLFDIPIDDLHTPCYLTDARLLQKNTALLKQIQQQPAAKSCWHKRRSRCSPPTR